MSKHVFLEVIICCALVFTLLAAEWLLPGMNKNVLFQITSIGGQVGAHWVSVRFFSSLLYFGLGCK